jgi:hypothetical protein
VQNRISRRCVVICGIGRRKIRTGTDRTEFFSPVGGDADADSDSDLTWTRTRTRWTEGQFGLHAC